MASRECWPRRRSARSSGRKRPRRLAGRSSSWRARVAGRTTSRWSSAVWKRPDTAPNGSETDAIRRGDRMNTAPAGFPRALKIRLSLKGRPIKAYVFNQDCVLIGRNPEADVVLDNPGISRDHLKIERAGNGYFVEDLNSANGTFVNDQRVQKQYLANED